MPLTIRILGCSGGACGDLRSTALLLDDSTLVDCGTGVGDLSLEEMARIHDVFLTHSHLDHVLFLPLLSDAALALRDGPLTVHALPETLAALKIHLFNGVLWPDYTALPSPQSPCIRLQALALHETCELAHGRITALPALHAVPAVGYLIDSGRASFAFSGDTTDCAAFWDKLNEVENLQYVMVETTMRDADSGIAERSRHTTPALLARGVARLKKAVQLLVTHIEPDKVEAVRAEIRAALAGITPPIVPHFVMRGEVYEL
ncbi:MAG TPA: 3',5'-cyclic-nucleotide phosphodiesterase [Novimethylophilus sp.]|jgi:ribonuclease BN (tRNA processing enzyme)|uniref:3',5'-cyclic-nucleotide phosphodiesterase n=1 Tax=Novimethylophilus sp. TaxID=2137426 RepID=UPI002F3F74E7